MPDSPPIPAPFWHDPASLDGPARRAERRIFVLTMALVIVLFGALYNRWWVPGGDSDFYLVCARNIAAGRHYTFNGMRVAKEPPGWPCILAGAMKISSSFAFLKCLNPAFMTIFLGLCFCIVRRFVPGPRTAAAIVLGTALLSNVYELTYWFHSDPLFCALSAAEFLLALQIREGRRAPGRIVLLLLLCAASVFIRWAGPFNWPIIAGILLNGMRRPLFKRLTIAALLSFVVFTLTFLCLYNAVKLTPAEREAAAKSGLFVDESSRSDAQAYNFWDNLRFAGSAAPSLRARLEGVGYWLSWFFYEPLRMAGLKAKILSVPLGWLGIVLLGIQVKRAIAQAQWLWVGLAISCATFFVFWPNATVRYLLPFFAFLIIAMLEPLVVAGQQKGRWGKVCRTALAGFVGSCVLCNVALYGIETWVFRHRDFGAAYYCGVHRSLAAVGRGLIDLGAGDEQVAVNPRYENMGRPHSTRFGVRGLALLTNRNIVLIPYDIIKDAESPLPPPPPNVLDWARQHHIKYYVCEVPVSPWRWHFPMGWLQEKMEKKPVVPTASDWEIWDLSGPQPQHIDLPPAADWPTHVPGL